MITKFNLFESLHEEEEEGEEIILRILPEYLGDAIIGDFYVDEDSFKFYESVNKITFEYISIGDYTEDYEGDAESDANLIIDKLGKMIGKENFEYDTFNTSYDGTDECVVANIELLLDSDDLIQIFAKMDINIIIELIKYIPDDIIKNNNLEYLIDSTELDII